MTFLDIRWLACPTTYRGGSSTVVGFIFSALVGGILTATLIGLSQHSWMLALLSAPVGGSMLALAVSLGCVLSDVTLTSHMAETDEPSSTGACVSIAGRQSRLR